ncbi:hypothetical protein ACFL5O_01320, partial [Myxococcota bacterium]
MGELMAGLPDLQRPVGRPAKPAPEPSASVPTQAHQVTVAVLRWVKAHPGCVSSGSQRARYVDAFSQTVVELWQQHSDLGLEAFAAAVDVPLGTLKDWLSVPVEAATADAAARASQELASGNR